MKFDSAIQRRLTSYWKMEGGCALAFPILGIWLGRPGSALEWGALMLALLACCALLLIGALYWRASLRLVRGDSAPLRTTLVIADRLQAILLALTLIAAAAVIALLMTGGSRAPVIAASVFALLAGLEYVNYFHVQLQNFDHLPDLKRLLRTRRFRRAHLARDLADYRRRGAR